MEELRQHRRQQQHYRGILGEAYRDLDLVNCHEDGRPLDPNEVSRQFSALAKKLGLPPVRFHDLRHTHASLLLAQGVNPKVVSERLGHSTVAITMDIYSHVMPGLQEEVAAKVESILKMPK